MESIFQVSRYVAVLLLLASRRRIHDLTLLCINPENCSVKTDEIIFWPMYGSKTDNANYRQSAWKLTSSDQMEYDLIKCVKQLIKVSEQRRKAQPNLNNLFITTRGQVKNASRTVIAGWVKTVFMDLGIKASPGSIRSTVASFDFHNNVSLDAILRRGNWKGAVNFFKHYCKIIENSESQSNQMLFPNYLNPCDTVKCP